MGLSMVFFHGSKGVLMMLFFRSGGFWVGFFGEMGI